MFSFIVWDALPEIFSTKVLNLYLEPRWYGLLFAAAFIIGRQLLFYIFRKEHKPADDVETLTVYMVLATVIGARLGHVLFYEPELYFNKGLEGILEIFKIWHGGLASHGAAIAILFTFWLYVRRRRAHGQTYLWIADRIVIIVALAGCMIRLGNLMNSEIIGKPTNKPWGFVFTSSARDGLMKRYHPDYIRQVQTISDATRKDTLIQGQVFVPVLIEVTVQERYAATTDVNGFARNDLIPFLHQGEPAKHLIADTRFFKPAIGSDHGQTLVSIQAYGIPRHPAQLYEAISCFVLFLLLLAIWNYYKARTPQGLLLGIFLVVCFGLRFVYEYLKEPQVDFENELPLYMGQWLSIPALLAGFIVLLIARRNAKRSHTTPVTENA